nr:hypothetical protein [Tanacetum cinerariifolium]
YGSHAQSLTPLSITYPSKDFQSSVHHNIYNPSSSIPQVEYAPSVHQQFDFSQPDFGLIVPVFQKGDDPIDAVNHMLSFLTAVVTSRYPPTNNQLRNSSNPRQQATINNGRVTVQPIQGRQNSLAASTSRPYTSGPSGNNSGKERTVVCYNCTVKFGNDHVAKIMGYGDYKIGNVTISKVYFMEELGHNLFTVGQFCDSDLEVAFRQHTCFIRNLEGKSHNPKSEDTNQEKLYLLHMDLCRPMRVESVNGKKYILVIVDDYSRFTWVKCLRSKDEATDFIIKFLKMIKYDLRCQSVVGISYETSVARSPHQNGVIERRNHTLIEAARTMLIYAQALLFLWVEAMATACYTQNRSIVRLYHSETPYELLHDKLPDLSFLHVFGALCYPTNDNENLGKLQPKTDIGIFIGYTPTKKAFRIYNRRTRRIVETIHVDFDELTALASEQSSLGPALHEMNPATISSGLVPKPTSSTPFIPPSRNDWDLLFQPLFDELLTPTPSVDPPTPKVINPISEVIAPVPVASTGLHSSTIVDQDAPSPSKSQTTPETQSPVITHDVEEDNHDIEVAHMGNDPLFGADNRPPMLEKDMYDSWKSRMEIYMMNR